MANNENIKYLIRRAEVLDAEEMAMIDQRCLLLPWSVDSFHRELTKNKIAIYIVAECGGLVVGYAGVYDLTKNLS